MEKNIRDYLHLYLGCAVKHNSFEAPLQLKSVNTKGIRVGGFDDDVSYQSLVDNIKPILRPLSDMTKNENKELSDIIGLETDKETHIWTPEQFLWLLSKYFDLFGLIEAGLAIDKTKLVK